jgi:hypothetical protein
MIHRRLQRRWNFKKEESDMRRVLAVALVMVFPLPLILEAIVMMPETVDVPVNRLILNTGQYIKAHPKDSEGYYLLGRLHSFAFAGNSKTAESKYYSLFDSAALPQAPFVEPVPRQERSVPGKILPEGARWHLSESLRSYQRATELKPKQPLAYLGLGWMLEQGARFADQVNAPFKKPAGRASVQEWRAEALAVYRRLAANPEDLFDVGSPRPESPEGLRLEASRAILRLLPGPDLSPEEKVDTERARKVISDAEENAKKAAAGQPDGQFGDRHIISPIIFPLRGTAPLEALLAPGRVVSFDLAGNGVPAKWPWVNSDAGFLVWDPENRQRIESGRQLFGSVTWWVFWRDGYAALAALDDDGNGWLEGDELAGIAIWRDLNGNGVCDPGEVISLRDAGIVRIAVRASGRTNGMPFNAQGIQLRDQTFRPTYDWTPESIVTGVEDRDAKPGLRSRLLPSRSQ